jgi:hypothetical protein
MAHHQQFFSSMIYTPLISSASVAGIPFQLVGSLGGWSQLAGRRLASDVSSSILKHGDHVTSTVSGMEAVLSLRLDCAIGDAGTMSFSWTMGIHSLRVLVNSRTYSHILKQISSPLAYYHRVICAQPVRPRPYSRVHTQPSPQPQLRKPLALFLRLDDLLADALTLIYSINRDLSDLSLEHTYSIRASKFRKECELALVENTMDSRRRRNEWRMSLRRLAGS